MNHPKQPAAEETFRLLIENAMLRQICENLIAQIAQALAKKKGANRPATGGPNPNPKSYPPMKPSKPSDQK
jgi:hypothetical protein